ncbi:hypothetical protein, partial [Xanthomonas cucurbitae]|uniref:hypothetical protein n=1 Tax=Xanthomonas cucurbitae TaxID=56453 RepID=UPI001B806233
SLHTPAPRVAMPVRGYRPHPALRATFSRQREKESLVARDLSVALQLTIHRSLLPLAGEGARRADGAVHPHSDAARCHACSRMATAPESRRHFGTPLASS